MSEEERKIALYCLKANSDYHSEVCEECINYPNCDHTIQDDVTETIIKALEQNPCEDTVSRQAVLDALESIGSLDTEADREYARSVFEALSPTPKMGHWIRFKNKENGCYHIKCSECGQYWSVDGHAKIFKRCFNCGTKMQGVKE